MKSQSTVRPDKVELLRIIGDKATYLLRKNIEEQSQDDGSILYVYDEVELTLDYREGLTETIISHFDDFYALGEQIYFEKSLPSEVEVLMTLVTSLLFEVEFLNARVSGLEASLHD